MVFHYLIIGFRWLLIQLPYFKFIRETRKSETPITLFIWLTQKVMRINSTAYWPMHHASIVSYSKNVYAGIDTCPGYNPGCYIHAVNKIYIGDYTQIAPNVGLMSGNHDLYDFRNQIMGNPIKIGKYCWIGMGVVIMPEVELGDFTIVGAGAIVTKSFPEGYCVIAGNPAKKIRDLEIEKCKMFKTEDPYNGYIAHAKFEAYRAKYLNV
jgi:acetyltransferase-like isoleucine patch superfamily enzyme